MNRSDLVADIESAGFTVVENLFLSHQIDLLLEKSMPLWNLHRRPDKPHTKVELSGSDLLRYQVFRDIIENDELLATAVEYLGWNIQVSYLGIVFNPPQLASKRGLGWHRDGGRVCLDLAGALKPKLSVKAAIWLTDGQSDDCGAFWAVPGSHRIENVVTSDGEPPAGAIHVRVRPGDVILFDGRLWHARLANHSNNLRVVAFCEYSVRWIEPKCILDIPTEIRDFVNPRIAQLLNCNDPQWRSFAPREDESAIKHWYEGRRD